MLGLVGGAGDAVVVGALVEGKEVGGGGVDLLLGPPTGAGVFPFVGGFVAVGAEGSAETAELGVCATVGVRRYA